MWLFGSIFGDFQALFKFEFRFQITIFHNEIRFEFCRFTQKSAVARESTLQAGVRVRVS